MKAAVFVIDDQKSVADAAARYLRAHGHQVRVETDGWTALQVLLSPEEFDAVLLDVLMPVPTGGQIYNILKTSAPGRLPRLAFYTGMGVLAETWLRHTGLPIVEKGVNAPEEILRLVTRFAELDCSKGPMPHKKHQSKPELDSDPPVSLDSYDEEPTAVTRRAQGGDVIAVKLKHLESKFNENKDATNERLEKIEGHFEEKGLVAELASDMKIAKSWLNRFPVVIAAIFTIITTAAGGVAYLIHQSERDRDLQDQQRRYESQQKKYDELIQKASVNALPPGK